MTRGAGGSRVRTTTNTTRTKCAGRAGGQESMVRRTQEGTRRTMRRRKENRVEKQRAWKATTVRTRKEELREGQETR